MEVTVNFRHHQESAQASEAADNSAGCKTTVQSMDCWSGQGVSDLFQCGTGWGYFEVTAGRVRKM
jgi:hypothetical protein